MRTYSKTVSFRADQDMLKMIDDECTRFGISRGSWSRGAVIAHLHQLGASRQQSNIVALEDRFDSFEELLDSISTDVAKSLYYILTNVGDMSPEKAKELVRTKLGQQE